MNELCKRTGIKQKLSTAYHPQTDGQTEIMNQILDHRLRPFISHYQDNRSEMLPALDLAGASLPHDLTGLSPHMVVMSHEVRMEFDWMDKEAVDDLPIRERINRQEG